MDFLNKTGAQLRDLFQPMNPAARITTGLLLAAIVVSLVYLFRSETSSTDDFLFGAQTLSQREIDNMALAFGSAGLNDWEVEQHKIKVPRTQRDKYLAAIHDANAYPEHPGVPSAELFKSTNPLESRDVRDRKALRVKERELENLLRELHNIEEVFVQITDASQKSAIGHQNERHVLIQARGFGNNHLDEELVKSIRKAGARGTGAKIENVSVTDANSGITFEGDGSGGSFGEDNLFALTQRRWEQTYKRKIEDQLKFIQGISVEVFVGLDKNLKHQTTTQTYDDPVPVSDTEYVKESNSTNMPQGGVPGARANGIGQNEALAISGESGSENTLSESRNETNRIAGSTQQITEQAPLATEYVTASVAVPWSYYGKVWRSKNPGGDEPSPDDLSDIESEIKVLVENVVRTVIPRTSPGEDPFPRITVATYHETPLAMPPGPGFTENASSWFASNWQTIGLFIMAFVGLWMLRSMLRTTQAVPVAAGEQTIPIESLASGGERSEASDEEMDEEDLANSLKARFQHSGRSLREELTELVREDPDAAANVLQNWIGDAA